MTTEIYRILDANFNRAREAVRILEDFARFTLNDKIATAELKEIRQMLGRLSASFGSKLVASRDSVYDVGKRLDESIKKRRTGDGLVAANFKRLEEALRSIEEYSRIFNIVASNKSQRLRFRVYIIEKDLTTILNKRQRLKNAKLYVILDNIAITKSLEFVAKEALLGGADILQLRNGFGNRKFLMIAKTIRALTQKYNALFIVNDRVDIAKAVDADGVHLGRHDLPISKARDILPSHKIIGATTHNLSEVEMAIKAGADYISVGPMFPSLTKPDISPKGFTYLKQALKVAGNTSIFCIGGIDASNVRSIVASGVNRIAVSRGVIFSNDIKAAARGLKSAL